MSLTNGDLYNTLKFLANKQQLGGNIRINDFNTQLKTQSTILLREKLAQKGTSAFLDDETNMFKKKGTLSFSGGNANIPADYFRYDSIRVSGAYEDVEVLFSGEVSHRLQNAIDNPTTLFPVGEFIGSKFYIYPTTITSADIVYYKQPTTPVFDYYIDGYGDIQYMPVGTTHELVAGEEYSDGSTSGTVTSVSVESEFGDDGKIDLLYLIGKAFGLNLQRGDIFQAMNQMQNEGK